MSQKNLREQNSYLLSVLKFSLSTLKFSGQCILVVYNKTDIPGELARYKASRSSSDCNKWLTFLPIQTIIYCKRNAQSRKSQRAWNSVQSKSRASEPILGEAQLRAVSRFRSESFFLPQEWTLPHCAS